MSVLPSENILNVTAKAPNLMVRVTEASAAALAMDPLSHVGDGIFLQTKTAQGIAGAFVWVALFLTCQQVRLYFIYIFVYFNIEINYIIKCWLLNLLTILHPLS